MRTIPVTEDVYGKLRELAQLQARNAGEPPPRFLDQEMGELLGDLVEERLCFARTLGTAVRAIRGARR